MSKKPKTPSKDLTKEAPINLGELNKTNMFNFVEQRGDEDLAWFIDLLDANVVEKDDPLHKGKKIKGNDWKPIRTAFAKKYFPNALPQSTINDRIAEARKRLGK